MEWHGILHQGEQVLWEGRPAPRCFTFRRWIHTIFGVLLLPLCWVWLDGGRALAATRNEVIWALIPWLGFAVAFYFLFGHLVMARLEWEKTFYAITTQRVVAVGGWPKVRVHVLLRDDLTHLKMLPRGEQLGTLFLRGSDRSSTLVLPCVEHPSRAIVLLEESIRANTGIGSLRAESD